MDELDKSGRLNMCVLAVAARTTRENHNQWTQAFTAAGNDVLGDLINQRDGAF
jgi:hypothetical protein